MKIIPQAQAAIKNPVLNQFTTPSQAGAGLAFYIGQIWKALVIVGGLAFLIYFILGGLQWITSGGDKAKVEQAQKQITNGLTGLIIVVAAYAVFVLIKNFLGLNQALPNS